MKKRLLSVLIALCLVIALVPSGLITKTVEAAKTDTSRYFYNQLDEKAKLLYDGMVEMYNSGLFETGDGIYEFTAEKYPALQPLIQQHMTGSANILYDYAAARDAFYADYPDIFYVDFSALTVKITSNNGEYHLYLGPGRYDTYYTQGFTSKNDVELALAEYKTALDALVRAGRAESSPEKQVEAVHDYITKSVTYRDELSVLNPNDMGFIRTAYGALVKHEGVCEAYTRAFKAAMDVLGIPCVVVYGVYRHDDNVAEFHIWNEVEIDGEWFAVDVTMDDPINPKTQSVSTGDDGYENHKYMLVGTSVMALNHQESSQMSESGFKFGYPMVGIDAHGITDIGDENSPLRIRYKVNEFEDIQAGTFYVSYMGMNVTDMIKNGYYLIMRNKVFDVDKGWQNTEWYYVIPEMYDNAGFPNVGNETAFYMGHVQYLEFGVTTTPYPPLLPPNEMLNYDSYFHGDTTLLLADSGMIENEYGDYKAAPAVMKATPKMTVTLDIGPTYHIKAYYNDILVTPKVYSQFCEPGDVNVPGYQEALRSATVKDINVKVDIIDRLTGKYQSDSYYNSLINNFALSFEGQETVLEFDFKPSELWADDNVLYDFTLQGLVGAYSGKEPAPFTYGAAHPCAICCWKSRGFDYNVFAKPTLVDDSDLSMTGWKDSEGNTWDGTPWDENYKSRLMLVVSDTGMKDSHKMEEMVKNAGEDVLSALTYNINLTLCKKQWAELGDGMSVRIQLGFPEGYGPDDEGVTFKAYHFNKNSMGEIISIDEIPCTITKYGLLIEVKSFSPFAIVAVHGEPDPEKRIELISDVGGSVTAVGSENGSLVLNPGEKATVTVTADPGYVIDTVIASDLTENRNYTGNESEYTFEIGYDDIALGATIVNATFVTEKVSNELSGVTVLPTASKPGEFSIGALGTVTAQNGGELTLRVPNPNNAYTYQWYLVDGNGIGHDKMVGTGDELVISSVDASYAGTYYVVAIASAAGSTASTKSNDTVIVVVSNSGSHTHAYGTQAVPDAELGHHFICTVCGQSSEIYQHTYSVYGVCTACGYTAAQTHTHTYYAQFDSNYHWGRCSGCGEITGYAPHSFVNDICTVCLYTRPSTGLADPVNPPENVPDDDRVDIDAPTESTEQITDDAPGDSY